VNDGRHAPASAAVCRRPIRQLVLDRRFVASRSGQSRAAFPRRLGILADSRDVDVRQGRGMADDRSQV